MREARLQWALGFVPWEVYTKRMTFKGKEPAFLEVKGRAVLASVGAGATGAQEAAGAGPPKIQVRICCEGVQ